MTAHSQDRQGARLVSRYAGPHNTDEENEHFAQAPAANHAFRLGAKGSGTGICGEK